MEHWNWEKIVTLKHIIGLVFVLFGIIGGAVWVYGKLVWYYADIVNSVHSNSKDVSTLEANVKNKAEQSQVVSLQRSVEHITDSLTQLKEKLLSVGMEKADKAVIDSFRTTINDLKADLKELQQATTSWQKDRQADKASVEAFQGNVAKLESELKALSEKVTAFLGDTPMALTEIQQNLNSAQQALTNRLTELEESKKSATADLLQTKGAILTEIEKAVESAQAGVQKTLTDGVQNDIQQHLDSAQTTLTDLLTELEQSANTNLLQTKGIALTEIQTAVESAQTALNEAQKTVQKTVQEATQTQTEIQQANKALTEIQQQTEAALTDIQQNAQLAQTNLAQLQQQIDSAQAKFQDINAALARIRQELDSAENTIQQAKQAAIADIQQEKAKILTEIHQAKHPAIGDVSWQIPTGAVMGFDLETCPKGWRGFTPRHNSIIVDAETANGLSTQVREHSFGGGNPALSTNEIPNHLKISVGDGEQSGYIESPNNAEADNNMLPSYVLLYCQKQP